LRSGAGRASCRCRPLRGASREVSGTKGLMCQTVRGYWVHRTLSTTPVSERGGRIPSNRSPERTVRFIPSCSRSSSEFLRSLSRPVPFGIRQLPGSLPSSRHHRVRPLDSRVPKSSIRSVRRCSQPLDGFLRLRLCRLVASRSRVQGHLLVQGLPLCAAAASSSEASCPLAVVHRAALRNKFRSPRSGALGFEAFIRAELAPRKVGS
jgi:hypothetical protein